MFKDNSRFSSLVDDSSGSKKSVFGKKKSARADDKKEEPKQESKQEPKQEPKQEQKPIAPSSNSFKNDRPMRDNYRRPYGRERDKEFMEMLQKQEQLREAAEEKKREEEIKIALSIESFPELAKVNSNKPILNSDFLEKLKTNVKVEIQVKDELKPGWTEIRRDRVNNQTIMTTNSIEKPTSISEEDLVYEVFEGLANLHEKRIDEYIENWGEDEWDRMFLFQNYDYYYFDKLDEIYAKNNPEPDSDEEYYDYSEEDDEYWKSY